MPKIELVCSSRLLERLHERSARSGLNISEIVRAAVDVYLDQHPAAEDGGAPLPLVLSVGGAGGQVYWDGEKFHGLAETGATRCECKGDPHAEG